jgi:hypothetical protein
MKKVHYRVPKSLQCCLGPCHYGMACNWVVDGGDDLQIWRVGANILNKQLSVADKGWSSSLVFGQGANNSSH